MRTQSCKAKGRRLQQLIARDILEAFPHLEYDDVRSTSMGAHGEDVQLSPLARECVPFSFEAKNQERLSIWAAIEQCVANAGAHEPCVVLKKNHSAVYAVVRWPTLLKLLASAHAAAHETDEPETSPDAPEAMEEDVCAAIDTALAAILRLKELAARADPASSIAESASFRAR